MFRLFAILRDNTINICGTHEVYIRFYINLTFYGVVLNLYIK